MLLHKNKFTGTLSSGAISFTSDKYSGREMVQLVVVPTSTTNTYTIAIRDSDNDLIVYYESFKGILIRWERIPLQGRYTITISGATIDEAITVVLRVGES